MLFFSSTSLEEKNERQKKRHESRWTRERKETKEKRKRTREKKKYPLSECVRGRERESVLVKLVLGKHDDGETKEQVHRREKKRGTERKKRKRKRKNKRKIITSVSLESQVVRRDLELRWTTTTCHFSCIS